MISVPPSSNWINEIQYLVLDNKKPQGLLTRHWGKLRTVQPLISSKRSVEKTEQYICSAAVNYLGNELSSWTNMKVRVGHSLYTVIKTDDKIQITVYKRLLESNSQKKLKSEVDNFLQLRSPQRF